MRESRQKAAIGVTPGRTGSSARLVAVDFLQAVLHAGRRLDQLNDNRGFVALEPSDRRLAFELVHGVLRHKLRLDYYIQTLAGRPLDRLDSVVTSILRVALYQLEFLRVPDRAAVHEAVELCRPFAKKSASGFINAVLRTFLREKPELPQGGVPALAVRYSHPEWLVQRYLARYGEPATEALLEHNNATPPPVVRVNTFKNDLEEFTDHLRAEQIEHSVLAEIPDSVLVHAPSFSQHPIYRDGRCYFMDAASQQVAGLGDVKSAKLIGDFCAAPGGKAFILVARSDASRVYCSDVSMRRLREMRARAAAYGVPRLQYVIADATQPLPFARQFDFVLADVPCTGLGTLRSNPDIKWKITEEHLPRYQARESAILSRSFAATRPGGELVYSTCSTEPEENEDVVAAFLQNEPEARLLAPFFRSYPAPHLGECFFAARIGHA